MNIKTANLFIFVFLSTTLAGMSPEGFKKNLSSSQEKSSSPMVARRILDDLVEEQKIKQPDDIWQLATFVTQELKKEGPIPSYLSSEEKEELLKDRTLKIVENEKTQ